jgi:hypothetical protein
VEGDIHFFEYIQVPDDKITCPGKYPPDFWQLSDPLVLPQSIWSDRRIVSSSPHGNAGRGKTMPDVTQAEVGRRLYHVHREKKVEEAIKLIQQGVGTGWRSLKEDEILLLGHLLQCTWNTIDQKKWDKIPFARISMDVVRKILSNGEGVSPGHNPEPSAVAEIKKILLSLK